MILKSEAADASTYREDPEATTIVQEEVEHFNVLGRLSGLPDHAQIISLERRHYSGTVNVRAGVLGFNDGLISNVSLVMGVTGATSDSTFIVIAGISGLLAGAFSMAAGEYVSVRAQRDVYEREIEVERAELEEVPREEAQELALIYQRKGFTRQEARAVAERIIANPEVALETLAREELGLDPDQLGNPWSAAISSFLAFGFGALIPLLPKPLHHRPPCPYLNRRVKRRGRIWNRRPARDPDRKEPLLGRRPYALCRCRGRRSDLRHRLPRRDFPGDPLARLQPKPGSEWVYTLRPTQSVTAASTGSPRLPPPPPSCPVAAP